MTVYIWLDPYAAAALTAALFASVIWKLYRTRP